MPRCFLLSQAPGVTFAKVLDMSYGSVLSGQVGKDSPAHISRVLIPNGQPHYQALSVSCSTHLAPPQAISYQQREAPGPAAAVLLRGKVFNLVVFCKLE